MQRMVFSGKKIILHQFVVAMVTHMTPAHAQPTGAHSPSHYRLKADYRFLQHVEIRIKDRPRRAIHVRINTNVVKRQGLLQLSEWSFGNLYKYISASCRKFVGE